jgi:hypothetical protein
MAKSIFVLQKKAARPLTPFRLSFAKPARTRSDSEVHGQFQKLEARECNLSEKLLY